MKKVYIYRDGCLIAALSKNSTSFLDYDIETNKKHTYKIVAFNSTEYSCPLKGENNIFENKVINYPLKNYYFSLKKCQPFNIDIISPREKEPLVTIKSISTGKEYKFCTLCTIDKNKSGYYIKYVNDGMLPAGDYEIIISNQDIKDLKIYSNISLYTSRLHNYSRMVYEHIILYNYKKQ